jgi:hypothetical protein
VASELTEQDCTCEPGDCDEEGDPGCAYCQTTDHELPCPAEVVPCPNHDDIDGPHHNEECCYYADERDE